MEAGGVRLPVTLLPWIFLIWLRSRLWEPGSRTEKYREILNNLSLSLHETLTSVIYCRPSRYTVYFSDALKYQVWKQKNIEYRGSHLWGGAHTTTILCCLTVWGSELRWWLTGRLELSTLLQSRAPPPAWLQSVTEQTERYQHRCGYLVFTFIN